MFEVSPSGSSWTESVFYEFPGMTNGPSQPHGGLIADSSGNLYGTTTAGGAHGYGTVFEVAAGSNIITTLASFDGSNTGAAPLGDLVEDSRGDLFGTTQQGGAYAPSPAAPGRVRAGAVSCGSRPRSRLGPGGPGASSPTAARQRRIPVEAAPGLQAARGTSKAQAYLKKSKCRS